MPCRGLVERLRSKFYTAFLYIVNFFVCSVTLGTMIWAAARVVQQPITYAISLKVGAIIGGIDTIVYLRSALVLKGRDKNG